MDSKRALQLGLAGLALLGIAALLWIGSSGRQGPADVPGEPAIEARPSPRRSPPPPTPEPAEEDASPTSPSAVVTGEVALPEGEAEWIGVEGCGAAVPIDEAGRFEVPVGEACELRVLVRNGGAESRGPKRTVGPETTEIALEAPEVPPWEPPVPPHWHEGGNQGLSEQERRDERLAYLRQVLAAGTLSPDREAMTREVVERLERQSFE